MTRGQRTIGLIAAALLLAVTAVTSQAQPQFSGTWVLDRSQSQFPQHDGRHAGKAPDAQQGAPQQPSVVKLIVDQQGNTLKVTRSMARDNRERTFTETLVADGSEHSKQDRRGGTHVTKATLGGDRLVVNSNHTMTGKDGQARAMSRESVWTVSPDGRTLTIDTTMHGPRGDRTMKTVYQKA
jgi:hypothetical protein